MERGMERWIDGGIDRGREGRESEEGRVGGRVI